MPEVAKLWKQDGEPVFSVPDVAPRQQSNQPLQSISAPKSGARHVYFVEWREALGLRPVDVAKRSGLSKYVISRLESGERQAKPAQIVQYAKGLGIDPGLLFHPPGKASAAVKLAALPKEDRDRVEGLIDRLSKLDS